MKGFSSLRKCLAIVSSLLFLSGAFMKNCTSSKMEQHRILHFLFVRGLTAISLLGGLGVMASM
jgi:hypothetical protein